MVSLYWKMFFHVIFCVCCLCSPHVLVYAGDGGSSHEEKYKRYSLGNAGIEDYILMPVDAEFEALGLVSNPGITSHEYLKTMGCITCNVANIEEVYMEMYVSKAVATDDAGIIIKQYRSEEALAGDISGMKVQDNMLFFREGNMLILFWSDEEDEDIQQRHFNSVTQHYQALGIHMLDDSQMMVSEFLPADFEDSTYVREHLIRINPDRVARYVFVSDGGFIAFFDDGTANICPDCQYCLSSMESVKGEKPFSLYQVVNNNIMMYSPDFDIQEPLVLPIHENEEVKEWGMVEYRELIPLTSDCHQ